MVRFGEIIRHYSYTTKHQTGTENDRYKCNLIIQYCQKAWLEHRKIIREI